MTQSAPRVDYSASILRPTKGDDKYTLRAVANVMNRVSLFTLYYYFYLVSSFMFNYSRTQLPGLVFGIVWTRRGGISTRRCLMRLLNEAQWPRCKI